MTERDEPTLEPRDRELVARVARHFAPPEETPGRRAAFERALRARLEAPRRARMLVPALAAAAVACVVWLALPGTAPQPPPPAAQPPTAWEYELLLSSDVSPAADREESLFLPDDLQAIAYVFVDP